jgi:hypothetical protein
MTWYEPKDHIPREPCPCCEFVTLPERGMSLICPVCFWEDDAFVGNVLHIYSLCNGMTLATGRANFVEIGACHPEMLPHVLDAQARQRFARRPTDSSDP